ncbi:hypothetical protein BDW69DRAFT_137889 [Aspergillus filifer]
MSSPTIPLPGDPDKVQTSSSRHSRNHSLQNIRRLRLITSSNRNKPSSATTTRPRTCGTVPFDI